MKTLTFLEGNMDLGGLVVMIFGVIAVILFVISLVVAVFAGGH